MSRITRDMTDDLNPENTYTQLLQIRKDDRARAAAEGLTGQEYYDSLKSSRDIFSAHITDWELDQLTAPEVA